MGILSGLSEMVGLGCLQKNESWKEEMMQKSPTGGRQEKHDFQILFKDSPEAYWVGNARMLIEGDFVRFVVFKEDVYDHDEFYPTIHIHRIKRIPQ